MAADHPWPKAMSKLCGVWRRLRGYGDEKSAVMSFAIYQRKHWVSREAVKRFFSRMTARLGTIKDPKQRRKFKLVLEHLRKAWLKYNKERVDRADNLRTFLPGRMWPWCVGPDASLPIETLLDPTLLFYTMENFMWVHGSADWCAEAVLVNESEPCRVDWLTSPEQHPYNTVYVPCNAHVRFFLTSGATVKVVHTSFLTCLWSRRTLTSRGIAPIVEPTTMRRWRTAKLEKPTLTPSPL
ncbi:hypothetical protein PHMEG_00013103 [Phytophthora megakarya]|uniref:Uncharacterized protein n=1 Tax=Phytophthora megakarya TaxID=4795 RepID=A0A225W742_9STRA|nr:hypothetical protein PHMEG_00013103 [Phytophthora megakarya]